MFRRCDSHNLNLSPLCNLQSDTKPSLWQQEVVETYKSVDGTLPNYVKVKYSLHFQSSKQWPLWNSVDATLVNMAPHSGKNSLWQKFSSWAKNGWKILKISHFSQNLDLKFMLSSSRSRSRSGLGQGPGQGSSLKQIQNWHFRVKNRDLERHI